MTLVRIPTLLIVFIIFSTQLLSNTLDKSLTYADPVPGAAYVKKEANIILKPSSLIDKQSLLQNGAVSLTGSVSGSILFTARTSEEGNTIILKPAKHFAPGEKITVSFGISVKSSLGKSIVPFSYSFTVRTTELQTTPLTGLINELRPDQIANLQNNRQTRNNKDGFPDITIDYSDNPSPGKLFLDNIVFNNSIPNTPHLLILNNDASPFFAEAFYGLVWNFDKQPDGRLTYYDQNAGEYYALDNNYNIVDTFDCGNGYGTDVHELRVLPNGHAFLLSYDPEAVDMSQIYPGGQTNATVVGLIIQELDQNKNVIFQWRSWDHFSILDATHEDFTAYYIDYVHGNALEIDNDGNIMLSSRHMDEITKINRTTGDIIWRMGGKNNQFTFTNDPEKFSHQHAIRRIADGNITMFDNGNFHTPPHSRAVEYSVDEVNKTVTLVWQYRHTPDCFGFAMGYVQRLPNNNTLICWGSTNPTLTEVRYDGSMTLELTFDSAIYSYRAYRYEFGDTLTGISGNNSSPVSFSLSQNFPNPFNPETKIRFDIPPGVRGNTSLKIFDELGREVAVLLNSAIEPGSHELNWNAANYPSGVYFYRLESGSFIQTKKMVLIK